MVETERWKLVATGKVQLVGYRERVAYEAEKRGLVGSVRNDEGNQRAVLIEAQGATAALEALRVAISTPEGRSQPRSVERVEELPVDPSLTEFQVLRGNLQLETLERMEIAGVVLGSMDHRLGSVDNRLGSLETLGKETLKAVQDGNRDLGASLKRIEALLSTEVRSEMLRLSTEVEGLKMQMADLQKHHVHSHSESVPSSG